MLLDITPLIRKLSEGQSLTAKETKRVFTSIIKEDKEGYFHLAFLSMLSAKGETSDELYGLCQAIAEFCPRIQTKINQDEIIDLSGTGGSRLKTFNISTTASFVVAGAGFYVAKQAFPGVTSPTGSADLFRYLGIDIFRVNREQVQTCLATTRIVPYNVIFSLAKGMENTKHFGQVQIEQRLNFRNPFHLMGSIYSPIKMRRRIYGMFSEKYLHTIADLFQKLGYVKGMVFYGMDGIDEISNIGKTKIIEFTAKRTKTYTIEPSDLGIKKAKFDDIKAISKERNIIDFLKIIYGKDKSPRRDIVLANTAVSLYVLGKAKDLAKGVKIAAGVINSGAAAKKLEELVDFLGDQKKLASWKKKAGI